MKQAWQTLKDNRNAALVDVRTQAEWAYVGVPDLSELSKDVIFVEWQVFPSMTRNVSFEDQVSKELDARRTVKDAPVLFLCRSGVRSKATAIAMTQIGYSQCFNVAGGFEGDLNSDRQRSSVNGWRLAHLPWIQI